MNHSHGNIRALAILAAAIAFAASAAKAQEPGPQLKDEHKLLQKDVGTWDATVKLWPVANAEPVESKGTEKNELLPGGLWLVTHFEGDFGGMKFVGVGTMGYDPEEKKYVGTWIDNMTPHLMVTKADYDAKTKTFTGKSESRDPATGKLLPTKSISRYVDDNTRVFEMYTPDPDGKEFKMMEMTCKKAM